MAGVKDSSVGVGVIRASTVAGVTATATATAGGGEGVGTFAPAVRATSLLGGGRTGNLTVSSAVLRRQVMTRV